MKSVDDWRNFKVFDFVKFSGYFTSFQDFEFSHKFFKSLMISEIFSDFSYVQWLMNIFKISQDFLKVLKNSEFFWCGVVINF